MDYAPYNPPIQQQGAAQPPLTSVVPATTTITPTSSWNAQDIQLQQPPGMATMQPAPQLQQPGIKSDDSLIYHGATSSQSLPTYEAIPSWSSSNQMGAPAEQQQQPAPAPPHNVVHLQQWPVVSNSHQIVQQHSLQAPHPQLSSNETCLQQHPSSTTLHQSQQSHYTQYHTSPLISQGVLADHSQPPPTYWNPDQIDHPVSSTSTGAILTTSLPNTDQPDNRTLIDPAMALAQPCVSSQSIPASTVLLSELPPQHMPPFDSQLTMANSSQMNAGFQQHEAPSLLEDALEVIKNQSTERFTSQSALLPEHSSSQQLPVGPTIDQQGVPFSSHRQQQHQTCSSSSGDDDDDPNRGSKTGKRESLRRHANNQRERIRVADINASFLALGALCAQHMNTDKNRTKLMILHDAVEVITHLEKAVKERRLDPRRACLRRREEEKTDEVGAGYLVSQ